MFCKVPGSVENWDFSACEQKSGKILIGLLVEIDSMLSFCFYHNKYFHISIYVFSVRIIILNKNCLKKT